jgi:hypothetical protein
VFFNFWISTGFFVGSRVTTFALAGVLVKHQGAERYFYFDCQ